MGGGNDSKNTIKSNNYLFQSLKTTKSSLQKLKNNLPLSSRVTVLIEFAVCMPVLIILLFYINDLVRIKRYYSQTEFVAQQLANIIQNISQKRGASDATKLKITLDDLKYAVSLADLTIFPGTTMFFNGTGYGFCYRPEVFITYVEGASDGTASRKWRITLPAGDQSSPQNLGSTLDSQTSNVSPSTIHPSLKINSGETKIIIESQILYKPSYKDYTGYQATTAKNAFKYYLLNPTPSQIWLNHEQKWYYKSIVIFTPKPGLFDSTLPA